MTLLEMSLAGALIILAAALIRALGKDRLPLWSFEALWALACLRLLAPVRLPWRFSVWAALDRASAAVPAAVPAVPGTALPDGPLVDMIQTPAIAAPSAPTLSPWTVAWAAGACALALAFAVSYVRARRRFRASEAVQDGPIGQWTAACPLRRRVSVRLSDRIAAPLTYGLFRPVILLPRSMDRTDSGTLGYVLAHELAHIRRFDAARKLVLAAAVCLHWFDPAVWLMLVLAGRDMERSCDRAVLDAYGADARADYARALLTLEERRADLGMASGFAKNAIEERIHSIMKIRKKSFLSTLLACALVLLRKKKRPCASMWYGKVATVLFYLSVCFILVMDGLLGLPWEAFSTYAFFLLGATAMMMLYSAVAYFRIFLEILRSDDQTNNLDLADEMRTKVIRERPEKTRKTR